MEDGNTEVLEDEILENEDEIVEDDAVEEYEPNFTYKVKDEERQFDERLHGVITNKEAEEYFRDLYTKADGLDHIKPKYETTRAELEEYRTGYNNLYSGYDKLKELRDNNQIRELAATLGVSDEQFLSAAIELAKEQNLPDEEREKIVKSREDNEKIAGLEKQIQALQGQVTGSRRESEEQSLRNELQDPKWTPLVNEMTAKGLNVYDLVIEHGTHMTRINNGKEPTIADAVSSTLARYAWMQPNSEVFNGQTPPVVTREKTLPKVRTAGSSKVNQPIRSIDDLRKLRDQMIS